MTRLLLLTLFAAACNESVADIPAKTEPVVKLDLVTATSESTPDILTLTGKIVADQRAEITADTQGKVLAVMAERGQHVERGQPVMRLDVRSAALGTSEASSNLDAARSELKLAEIECERAKMLFAKGAISKSELDHTITQCTSAQQRVGAANARTAMLAKGVSDGVVRAPFAGVISERAVNEGEWVAPGRALFTLVDADPLKVELSVPEANIPAIAFGRDVAISTISRPGKVFRATITRLAAEVGRTRSLIVEATVKDHEHQLVPGMFVEARVTTGQMQRPTLPSTAVVKRGKQWHAFVVEKGAVVDRIVQLGPSPGGGRVSIIQNITAGDRAVARITDQVTDGLRVE